MKLEQIATSKKIVRCDLESPIPGSAADLRSPASKSTLLNRWDAFVASCPESGIMQSSTWAALKKRQGLQVCHLIILEGQEIIGGAIAYASAHKSGLGILWVPEGPVLSWADSQNAEQCFNLLLSEFERLAPEYSCMAVRLEPRIRIRRENSTDTGSRLFKSMSRAPVDLIPSETIYLDLSENLDDLLSRMHEKARYNIKLSARKGVRVRTLQSEEDLFVFYALMKEASLRGDFFLEPMEFFQSLYKSLAESGNALAPRSSDALALGSSDALAPGSAGGSPAFGQIYFAEHEGDVLGTLFVVNYGKRSTYLYGCVSLQKRNLMAGYALQWQAIRDAKLAGSLQYDFYGYDSSGSPSHPYFGFSKFKSQFSGELVQFVGAHEKYFSSRLADVLIKAIKESEAISSGGR